MSSFKAHARRKMLGKGCVRLLRVILSTRRNDYKWILSTAAKMITFLRLDVEDGMNQVHRTRYHREKNRKRIRHFLKLPWVAGDARAAESRSPMLFFFLAPDDMYL